MRTSIHSNSNAAFNPLPATEPCTRISEPHAAVCYHDDTSLSARCRRPCRSTGLRLPLHVKVVVVVVGKRTAQVVGVALEVACELLEEGEGPLPIVGRPRAPVAAQDRFSRRIAGARAQPSRLGPLARTAREAARHAAGVARLAVDVRHDVRSLANRSCVITRQPLGVPQASRMAVGVVQRHRNVAAHLRRSDQVPIVTLKVY